MNCPVMGFVLRAVFFSFFFLNSIEVLTCGRSSCIYGGSEGADRGWKTAGLGVVSQL